MYLHADSGRHFYSKAGTGKSVWEHPNLGFYKMAIYMERSGWELVKVRVAFSCASVALVFPRWSCPPPHSKTVFTAPLQAASAVRTACDTANYNRTM